MNHTVLLVDDESNVLHGLSRAFRHQPFDLFTARSGEEAMDILKRQTVHVVVADEQMPGMRGGDLLAWIAKYFPKTTRIVLTGHPTAEAAIRAINEGVVYRYFTKPCNAVELALAIRRALEELETAAVSKGHASAACTAKARQAIPGVPVAK
jgi:DNA-binding NtrC family response regulator